MGERAIVREVGLRDGLQLVKTQVATEKKIAWCRAEAEAGVVEFEITSFVPPHVVAQFSDAVELAQAIIRLPQVKPAALVPNLKGAVRAFDLGVPKINFVLSASEQHNLANVRRTTEDSLLDFERILAERDARGLKGTVTVAGGIATSFGCTIQGAVPEQRVFEIAERLVRAGADELQIADTVGYGNPGQVRRIFATLMPIADGRPIYAHFHDTRGLGLANVTAAVEVGVRRFDASLAGLGGCPFAPGATGNINTEDTVFLLQSLGFETGIDIARLIEVRRMVEPWLPGERFSGSIFRAGLPKTFKASA